MRINFSEKNGWYALAFAVCMLSSRLLSSAYTSGDDGYTYMAAMAEHGWMKQTWEMVVFQGRFYQFFVYPLAMLPFQLDNILVVNLFKVATFLFFFTGFLFFCTQIFSSTISLGCGAVFLCCFETVGGSYNAFHGLPMWFGVTCGLVLFSIGTYHRHINFGDEKAKIYSCVCFGFALLGYEIVLLYLPVFIIISIVNLYKRSGFSVLFSWPSVLQVLQEVKYYIYACMLYLITYFLFRKYYPGTYVGAQGLSVSTVSDTLRPIWEFSINSVNIFDDILYDRKFSFTSLLYSCTVVFALLCSLIASKPIELSKQNAFIIFVLLSTVAVYIFIPNILFGLTDRYRLWARHGVEVYLGSLYSAVCLCVLICLALKWLFNIKSSNVWVFGICFVIGVSGVLSSYTNSKNSENFFTQSNMMSVRWDVADWVSQTISNSNHDSAYTFYLCSDGFIFNKELPIYFRNPDMIADALVYWNRYLTSHSDNSVSIVDVTDLSAQDIKQKNCTGQISMSYFTNSLEYTYQEKVAKFSLSSFKSLPNLIDSLNRLL